MMEGELTEGGEHTMQYIDAELYNYTPETYVINNQCHPNLMKNKNNPICFSRVVQAYPFRLIPSAASQFTRVEGRTGCCFKLIISCQQKVISPPLLLDSWSFNFPILFLHSHKNSGRSHGLSVLHQCS